MISSDRHLKIIFHLPCGKEMQGWDRSWVHSRGLFWRFVHQPPSLVPATPLPPCVGSSPGRESGRPFLGSLPSYKWTGNILPLLPGLNSRQTISYLYVKLSPASQALRSSVSPKCSRSSGFSPGLPLVPRWLCINPSRAMPPSENVTWAVEVI